MPNNDLGTAHGRIRIDFDDKGSSKATVALVKIQREFELLNKRVALLEKTLEKNGGELSKTAASMQKAEKSSKSFFGVLFDGSRITKAFDKDIVDLAQDVMKLNKAFNETRNKYKPLETAYKVLDRYQKLQPHLPIDLLEKSLRRLNFSPLADGERKIRSFYKSLNSVGLGAKAAGASLWRMVYGHKDAMAALPVWTRHVYAFSMSLGSLGAAGLLAGKRLNAGFITKFLNTNAFRRITLQAVAAGAAFERLGSISQKIFGKDIFRGLTAKLKNSEAGLTGFVKNLSHSLSGGSRAFNSWFKPIAAASKQIQNFVLGVGIMSAGIADLASKFSWLGRIPKPILVAMGVTISTIVPAALQVFDKALIGTSNILLGLLDGVKQLSGGLLVLPGLIASIGVVAATVKTIFSGLADQFKDVFSTDPAEAWEAFAKLPEHLKPMASALKETVKGFREMQVELQKVAFKGIETQIKSLSEKYLPLLKTGMTSVTLSIRGAKDEFVKFFEQSQTQKDVNTLFANTAEIISQLKDAIRPVSDGLKDIAVVGTRFIADLSAGAGTLTQKFAAWARVNRENGQMLEWMQDARDGVRDLVLGTKDLGKGLWEILTAFRSNTGSNWLESYANSMQRFNKAMSQSRKGGVLFDFASAVKGFGDGKEKIDTFVSVFKSFIKMMQGIAPAIVNISNAFSNIFIPQVQTAMEWLGNLGKLSSALNLDDLLGTIFGLVAGLKLLPTFLAPVFTTMKIIGGFVLTLTSVSGVVNAVNTGVVAFAGYLEKIPFVGRKVSDSLMNVATSASGMVSAFAKVAGPVAIVITLLASLFLLWRTGRENAKAFDAQLQVNAESAKTFGKELNKAFLEDNGLKGKTVMDQLSLGMDNMIRNLEDTAAKAPGMMDHLADMLTPGAAIDKREGFWGESKEINRRQAEGHAAELASEKLKELRKDGIDLEAAVSSAKPTFDKWINTLRLQGDAGKAAADVLIIQREQYDLVYDSMQRLGPSGVQLANGLEKIANAGGDAASKLDGLKLALQGLGFLKVDQIQAAADYTLALGNMAEEVRQVVESGGDISQAWDSVNNTLNTSSEMGAKLSSVFSRISNSFLQAANAGEPVDSLAQRLNTELENLAPILGRSADELKAFFRDNMGVAPEPIKILLQLEGKQDIAKSLADFMLQLTTSVDKGIPLNIHFETADAANKFDKQLEEWIGRDLTDQNGLDVVLKTGITPPTPEEMLALQNVLNSYGIVTSPGQLVAPAQMPVAPVPAPGTVLGPTVTPRQAAPPNVVNPVLPPMITQQTPVQPDVGLPVQLGPALNETSAKVDEIDGKMHNLVSRDNKITVNTEDITKADEVIVALKKKFDENELKAKVSVEGVDKLNEASTAAQTITTNVGNVFTTLKDQITEAVTNATEKIKELSSGVVTHLESAASEAKSAGSKFVEAFAQGMENNPRAIQAAADMAEKVLENFHRSPPKKGPLAQHGDAAKYGGKQFVTSYATGLRANSSEVSAAAGSVAGAAAAGAVRGGGAGIPQGQAGAGAGEFLGQLLAMTNFASMLTDVFTKVSDSMFRLAKYMSDPMGKGTFFGKSTGFKKTVSDAELQRKQNDEDQASVTSMREGGRRNLDNFQNQLDIITNAENAVADQSGRKSQEAPQTVGAFIKANFPEIATIGGARDDALPYHREGRALDIMIPDYNTPEGKALGDRINSLMLANAEKLGVESTIWQDFYQPAGGGNGNFMGNKGDTQGHFDHVHIQFASGAAVDLSGLEMNPEELANFQTDTAQKAKKTAIEAMQERYGPPLIDGVDPPAAVDDSTMRVNANGDYEIVTPHGTNTLPGPGTINPLTKAPWTAEESLQFANDNPLEFTLPEGMTPERLNEIKNTPEEFSMQTREESLASMSSSNAEVAKALAMAENPRNYSDADLQGGLTTLDTEIARLREQDTAGSRSQASQLESIQSGIMEDSGYTRNANPIDEISGMISNAAGVASDIIGTVVTAIETVGATKNITETLVRGVSGTEDVGKLIDNGQKYLELGSKVAGSVASVASLVGSVVGAGASADPSGGAGGAAAAIQGVATIASLVQAGFETANAVIDLTQEAVKIAGGYVGDFLGYLVGGSGGQLTGNVRFLLDQKTNQLLSYTAENSADKRIHNVPFAQHDQASRQQMIGNINVYGGPGSDPRDLTRQMMFQVNSAQYAGALAQ